MAGVKRSYDGKANEKESESGSPYLPMFEAFREELDEHHDRRERIIKASRDITAQSKKTIFALQRAPKVGSPLLQSITKSNEPIRSTIQTLFNSIERDLKGINSHRYQRQISPGIQEYMESVLFQHYLETEKVMTYDAATPLPGNVQLTHDDYALGLFDMTGELMRFAITYLATSGALPGAEEKEQYETGRSSILTDMQLLRSYLENIDASSSYGLAREFEQKLKTTRASVEKVEYGVYSMLVRGKERPKGWRPDVVEGPRDGDEFEAY